MDKSLHKQNHSYQVLLLLLVFSLDHLTINEFAHHEKMNRYQILIEYVGTSYIGWQTQKKGNSIQKTIQNVISKLLKENIKLHGSGRTDKGVHALEQSAHFDCQNKIKDINKLVKSLNFFLNKKIEYNNFTSLFEIDMYYN